MNARLAIGGWNEQIYLSVCAGAGGQPHHHTKRSKATAAESRRAQLDAALRLLTLDGSWERLLGHRGKSSTFFYVLLLPLDFTIQSTLHLHC